MQTWEVEYKGHLIRVENEIFREQLLIDSELQDGHSGLSMLGFLGESIMEKGKAPVMANVRSLVITPEKKRKRKAHSGYAITFLLKE